MHGFGLKVCLLLNLIADQAVLARDHKWKPFVYRSVGGADTVDTSDGTRGDGNEVDDDVRYILLVKSQDLLIVYCLYLAQVLDVDQNYDDVDNDGNDGGAHSIACDAFIARSMIFPDSAIKPDDWKAETERVGSKLVAMRAGRSKGGWAENLTNLTKHAQLAQSADGDGGLIESMRQLSVQISDSVLGLARVEKILNTKSLTESMRNQFKEFRQVREKNVMRHTCATHIWTLIGANRARR